MKINDRHNETILEGETVTKDLVEITNCTTCEIVNSNNFQESVNLSNCTTCEIVNCDFSYDEEDETMLILDNCKSCKVLKSEFHDKDKKGLFIKIVGKKSRDNLIDHCTFRDHRFPGENGGEPVRIGNSEDSGYWFKTIVQYCYFHDLGGDPESVSIKSCGNELKNNIHKNCKSSFAVRHGGSNTIQDNVFIGYGGIRVHGNTNKILKNYHMNNDYVKYKNEDGSRDYKYKPPLIIDNGNIENDPNFDDVGQPPEKPDEYKGCSHSAYARAKNNLIEGKTYHNCEGPCAEWGYKMRDGENKTKKCNDKTYEQKGPMHPTRNRFKKNTIMVDDGHGDSTLVAFTAGAEISDNTFEANELYGGNAKPGEIPQEAIVRGSKRPEEIKKMPDVDPAALKAVLGATAAPS